MCDGAGFRKDLLDVLATVCRHTRAPSDRYRAHVWRDPASGQAALLVLDCQRPNGMYAVVAET